MTNRRWVIRGALAVAICLGGGAGQGVLAATATSLSYTVSLPNLSGPPTTISFQGQADGATLTGTIQFEGQSEQVSATIGGDGSVSGKVFQADGTPLGLFWGQPNGPRSMKGSYDLNGQVGDWTVPLRVPAPKSQQGERPEPRA